jgi:sirohydrochlorin ferrochelatase
MAPILLAIAHGTRSPVGQAQVRALVRAVANRRPGLDVRLAYVDVQQPRIDVAVANLDRPTVVVPLLLTAGYHVRVDIVSAIAGADARATPPLGSDPRVMDLLCRTAAADEPDAVVLAAAGSTDPRARAEVDAVARGVADRLQRPVRVGYASAAAPRVPDAIVALRRAGARRVAIAAYLLVDGLFYRALHRAGADAVTAPLATSRTLVDLVLDRYAGAVSRTPSRPDTSARCQPVR